VSNSSKFRIPTGFGFINGKEMGHFCCEEATFFKFFGLGLYICKSFWTVFGFGLSFTKSGLELDRKI